MNLSPTELMHVHDAQAAGTCRVAPLEMAWIRRTEVRCARRVETFHRRATGWLQEARAADVMLAELSQRWAAVCERHGQLGQRDFKAALPVWAYFPLLVGLALLEVPVSLGALQRAGLDDAHALCMAIAVALFGASIAAVLGRSIRQARRLRDLAVPAVATVLALAVYVTIAALRDDHAQALAQEQGMPYTAWTLPFFLGLQLLLFAGGASLCWWMAPPCADLASVLSDKQRLRPQIQRALVRRARLLSKHEALRQSTLGRIEAERRHCEGVIQDYRDGNLMARRGTDPAPQWMKTAVPNRIWRPIEIEPAPLLAATSQA